MARIHTRRGIAIVATLGLVPLTMVGLTANTASAASEGQHASGWSSPDPVLWFPLPPAATEPLGAPNDTCIEGSSSPGNSVATFTFPAFSAPGGAAITGIEVVPKYRTAEELGHFIQLTDSGTPIGTERTLPENVTGPPACSSSSEVFLGGPGDLWGTAGMTGADFNAGNIGVRIRQRVEGEGATHIDGLDSIQLVIYYGNAAPTAEANGDYSVPEGGGVILSSAGSSDPDGDPLTIDWDLDDDGTFETPGASPSFSAVGRDGPDSQPIAVRVSDGTLDDTDTATVNITNVAPTIDSIDATPASIDEADAVVVSGTFSDPGTGETYTGSAIWSDGESSVVSIGAGTFSTTRTFPDDHPLSGTSSDEFTVEVTIDDGDGGSDAATSPTITVNNVDPMVDSIIVSSASIDEGDSVTVSGLFSDPALGEASETFSGSASWSDGPGGGVAVGGGTFSTSRTFLDDDPTATPSDDFTVDVTISDDDLGSDVATSSTITVNNVDPVLDPLSLSATVIDEHGGVTLTGSFTDVGLLDTHTVSVDWGEGAPEAATVVQAAGSGTFSAAHQYLDDDPTATSSDVYTITVTVTDDDSGSDVDSTSVTVDNVDQVISSIASSATFEDKAEEGETVTVSGAFTGVGTLDTHTATVDWGDGDIEPATVAQGSGGGTFTADHAYVAGGVYVVTMTVTDDDTGATSDSTLAVVTGVGVNGGVLQVVGTSGDDHVHVKTVQDEIDVFASFVSPKHRRFDLAGITSVEVWLCEGDDHGNVHQSIDLPTTIHGGADDDMLWGGSGPDVIEGEDGNDKIWGRDGDDELYGGEGNDMLWGGKGSDLLDGGPGNNELKQ